MQLGGIPQYCGGAFLIGLHGPEGNLTYCYGDKAKEEAFDKEFLENHCAYIDSVKAYALTMSQILWCNYNLGAYPAFGAPGTAQNPSTYVGQPVKTPLRNSHYIPYSLLTFQHVLRKLLVMSNYGVIYAVTNGTQKLARSHLQESGFVVGGNYSKSGGSTCTTWLGDVRNNIKPILDKIPLPLK